MDVLERWLYFHSTFVGSLRNMLQNYQDLMVIISKFSKPDLFITMTCNPKWFVKSKKIYS